MSQRSSSTSLGRLTFHRLEVFNGIIQNRLNDNPNVTYAIIRSHKLFEDLGTFTLASGLREVKRIQLTKEEQARADAKKGRKRELPDLEKQRATSIEYSETMSTSGATPEARNSGEVSLRGSDSEMIASAQPLMSPSGEEFPMIAPGLEENSPQQSEKARGKMPARTNSLSEETMSGLERLASSGVGRNGFVPTQEWVRRGCLSLAAKAVLMYSSHCRCHHGNKGESLRYSSLCLIDEFIDYLWTPFCWRFPSCYRRCKSCKLPRRRPALRPPWSTF